jgi:hypothetical protein
MNDITLNDELILNQIYLIRGLKVMIDNDLALLYQIENKQLKRQVRRNIERFHPDFMFELAVEEYQSLRSQNGTLKQGAHAKYMPMVFTEQGVTMLSSVLNSNRAIQVNIPVIRIFTRIRKILLDHTELQLEVEKIEAQLNNHGKNMEIVFQYLDELVQKRESREKEKHWL